MEWLKWLEEQILRCLSTFIHVSRMQLLQRSNTQDTNACFQNGWKDGDDSGGIACLAETYGRHFPSLFKLDYMGNNKIACRYLLHVMIEFRFHHLDIPVVYLL